MTPTTMNTEFGVYGIPETRVNLAVVDRHSPVQVLTVL